MPDLPAALRLLGECLIALAATSALDSQANQTRFTGSDPKTDLQPQEEPSRRLETASWLTPEEAAIRLGVTKRWLIRRWRRPGFEFCRPLPGQARGFRVNAAELEAAMKRRR